MTDKKILVGLLFRPYLDDVAQECCEKGYFPMCFTNFEQTFEAAKEREFQRYLVDVNLGNPGKIDCSSSKQIYDLVKERIEQGSAKFVAVSSSKDLVLCARKAGLPAEVLGDLGSFDLKEFLKI